MAELFPSVDLLQVPDVQVQDYLETQPLFSTHLDMSLGEIATVLLQPLFFERVFQADVGAFNVAASHWGQTQQKQLVFRYCTVCSDCMYITCSKVQR